MNVRFGHWELRKRDAGNWELFHFGACVGRGSNKTDGEPRWRSTGRYYQANTFHLAIEYAADWELRNHDGDDTIEMAEYLHFYCKKLERFKTEFYESVHAD